MSEDILQRIGSKIKLMREERGWSIRDLAKISGVNKSNICSIESGKYDVRLRTLGKLEIAFEKKIDFT